MLLHRGSQPNVCLLSLVFFGVDAIWSASPCLFWCKKTNQLAFQRDLQGPHTASGHWPAAQWAVKCFGAVLAWRLEKWDCDRGDAVSDPQTGKINVVGERERRCFPLPHYHLWGALEPGALRRPAEQTVAAQSSFQVCGNLIKEKEKFALSESFLKIIKV